MTNRVRYDDGHVIETSQKTYGFNRGMGPRRGGGLSQRRAATSGASTVAP